jgi:hypothetical protein
MLLRSLLLLAFAGMLSETIVQGAAALARAALQERALDAARLGYAGAIDSAQQWLAQTIAAQQSPSSAALPAKLATCAVSESDGCRMNVVSAFATPSPVTSAPGGCPATDCTVYLQANSSIGESRYAMRVVTTVTGPDGRQLAERSGTVAFRTFETPPYAALAGAIDATLDGIAQNGTGDDGGNASGSGTLVNVEYVPQDVPSAAPLAGNVWQPVQQHPATIFPSWSY